MQPVQIPVGAEELVADFETKDVEFDIEDGDNLEGVYVDTGGRDVVP